MSVRRLALVQPETGGAAARQVAALIEAARREGLHARAFTSSDPLEEFDPDLVIALSPEVPKLTKHLTYGFLTGSWLDYQQPRLLRNVLSYDAYLTASAAVKQWVEDITFGARKVAPVGVLAPSVATTPPPTGTPLRTQLVVMPGDDRAAAIARQLADRDGVTMADMAGPAAHVAQRLRETLAGAGVGLWIDPERQATDGQPALPFFEIIAAGAVVITNRNPFVEEHFGDAVLYVDADAPPEVVAWQIDRHRAWIAANPEAAAACVARAHEVFSTTLALEVGLRALVAGHPQVRADKQFRDAAGTATTAFEPTIACIVRTQGAPERVLDSLRAQRYPNLRTFLVASSPSRDLTPVAARYADLSPTVLPPVPGPASSVLWAGLRAVHESGADLFAVLDDRDELFPNHIRTLVRTVDNLEGRSWFGSFGVVYSATAEAARTTFAGDRLARATDAARPSRLRVRHYRFYHPGYLDDGAHQVHPGAFLARTALLDDEILTDPGMDEGAESYLELLLAEKTLFGFSCELTAITRDRDDDVADGRQATPVEEHVQRAFFRTYGRQFPAASVYLHNVIFMTAFDKDLLAPILMPSANTETTAGVDPAWTPVGEAFHDGTSVRVSGRPESGAATQSCRFGSGRYRLRLYYATPAPRQDEPPFDVSLTREGRGGFALDAPLLSVRHLGEASVAEYELEVAHEQAVAPASLRLEPRDGRGFDLLGARVDRLARVLSRSVQDLPIDRPLWLYGAGEGGRQAKRKLELSGLRVEGFIDKFKTGSLEGVPIVDLPTAKQRLDVDATVIIASMFWEEIRKDIDAAGVSATLYSFYPFTGDVVYALN